MDIIGVKYHEFEFESETEFWIQNLKTWQLKSQNSKTRIPSGKLLEEAIHKTLDGYQLDNIICVYKLLI